MKKLTNKKLAALCYAGFLLVSLLLAAAQLGLNAFWRGTGKMETAVLGAEAFERINLQPQPDGTLVTTTDDPRMVLKDCPERVSRVQVQVKFLNLDPGEFTLFYQTRPGMEDFDANYRLWAKQEGNGVYSFSLPQDKIYGLRLDPGIYAGIQMELTSVTLNPQVSAISWFVPTNAWLVAFAVFPALIASALAYLRAVAAFFKGRRANKMP